MQRAALVMVLWAGAAVVAQAAAEPGISSDAIRRAWLAPLVQQADSTFVGSAGATDDDPRPEADPGPFARGRTRFGLMAGYGSSGSEEYFLLGLGVGYYLANGLDLGLDFEAWLGGSPGFYKISPGLRYVVYQAPTFKPYVGVLYRHTFVTDNFEDRDSLGGRGGIYYASQGGTYISAGVVYERYFNCDVGDCDELYPEFTVSIFR